MPLNLIPGNREIIDLLASHVTGPYRFVHHAMVPYVRISPSSEEPVTVRGSETVQVHGGTRTLQGLHDVLDFAVMFVGSGIHLMDVGMTPSKRRIAASSLAGIEGARVAAEGQAPEGWSSATKPPRHTRPKVMTMVTAPQPEPPRQPEATVLPVPAWLETIRVDEDVDPDQRDYLVIPETRAPKEPLPAWVVVSARVDAVHVVKPRLDEDRVLVEKV